VGPKFLPVWQEIGSGNWAENVKKIMVPLDDSRLVLLEGAQTWSADPHHVEVTPVGKSDTLTALSHYLDGTITLNKKYRQILIGPLLERITRAQSNGGQLLSVKGKAAGQSWLKSGTTSQNLVVADESVFLASYKFMRSHDDNDNMVATTTRNPAEVNDWSSQLRWIRIGPRHRRVTQTRVSE
jgi:hypothetical protein